MKQIKKTIKMPDNEGYIINCPFCDGVNQVDVDYYIIDKCKHYYDFNHHTKEMIFDNNEQESAINHELIERTNKTRLLLDGFINLLHKHMELKLCDYKNVGKIQWDKCSIDFLIEQTRNESKEMLFAIEDKKDPLTILNEIADIVNYLMFIFDNYRKEYDENNKTKS